MSTRGQSPKAGFTDILLGGLAPDGGLYLPESYPHFSDAELTVMRGMNYRELALAIISCYVDDIPADDLKTLIDRTYTAQTYHFVREGQNPEDITPLLTLEPGLHLLSLSNGPTLAFKDMAMQLLGNLFEYELRRRNESINIVGATSGDTGSAAEYAMRGKQGIRVFMLSPMEGMTPFQQAQMYSLQDPNIFNIAVKGVFDDCQDMVKAVSNDAAFKAKYKIGAVNSINWARVLAQIVYYFKAYFAVSETNTQKVDFAVPSGNFGNICAGHIARMMGLPIDKLIAATNENDVLDEFFRTGVYRPRDAVHTYHTSSPSMDISKASNFERFAFDLTGRDAEKIRNMWAKVDRGEAVDFNAEGLFGRVPEFGFVSGASNHALRMQTIREMYELYGVVIDTHTADGLNVGLRHRQPGTPLIVLETALPAKFEDAIVEAIGQKPERPAELADLEARPRRVEIMDPDVGVLKSYIAAKVDDAKI
ncbi:MAG: threonine synthase [Hydrogenophilaceae bacterium]|nr:threonine synthase [Hydrogenophilaceae bacterium]